ncbi:unnamed protein product, partial [Ixodes hexagonus]
MHRARSTPAPSTLRSPWLLLLVLFGARGGEAYFAKDSDDYRAAASAAAAGGALQAAQGPAAPRGQLPADLEEYANLMLLLREYLIKEAARYPDQAAGKGHYGDPAELQSVVSKRGG